MLKKNRTHIWSAFGTIFAVFLFRFGQERVDLKDCSESSDLQRWSKLQSIRSILAQQCCQKSTKKQNCQHIGWEAWKRKGRGGGVAPSKLIVNSIKRKVLEVYCEKEKGEEWQLCKFKVGRLRELTREGNSLQQISTFRGRNHSAEEELLVLIYCTQGVQVQSWQLQLPNEQDDLSCWGS